MANKYTFIHLLVVFFSRLFRAGCFFLLFLLLLLLLLCKRNEQTFLKFHAHNRPTIRLIEFDFFSHQAFFFFKFNSLDHFNGSESNNRSHWNNRMVTMSSIERIFVRFRPKIEDTMSNWIKNIRMNNYFNWYSCW